jgi:hypothetical protein
LLYDFVSLRKYELSIVILKGDNMLTSEPTMEIISEWKKIFEKHKGNLMPNRKSGIEVDKYFREKYNLLKNIMFGLNYNLKNVNLGVWNFPQEKLPTTGW